MREFNVYINCVLDILDENGHSYKSRVQDISEEGISIDMPMENGEYVLFHKGDEIGTIIYNDKTGILYKARLKVLERTINNKLRLYKVSKPYGIERLQRRNYVRVNTTRIVKYKKKDEGIYSDSIMLDLSGGGMRLRINKELRINDKLELIIDLDGKFAKINGEVTRVFFDKESKKYVVGIEFIDIKEIVRDRIIQIVFSIMRRQIEVL